MSDTELARAFFTHMGAGDVNASLALLAPTAQIHLLPLQKQGKASEVGRDYLQQLAHAFPDLRVRVRRLFVGSNQTAVGEITIEGTQAADFFGIINQEKLMDLDQVWLLHLHNGAIDQIRAYWCQNRLYRRLGVKRLDHVTITA
jgi:ketosteroid isomerase-like protein